MIRFARFFRRSLMLAAFLKLACVLVLQAAAETPTHERLSLNDGWRFQKDDPAGPGDATDLTEFASPERKAFNGLALVIIRAKPGVGGKIVLKASCEGMLPATVTLKAAN